MPTMTVEEARAKLPELIAQLAPGEEVLLTSDDRPVAKLVRHPGDQPRPVYGRGRGKVVVVSEDDEHLRAFEEYMP